MPKPRRSNDWGFPRWRGYESERAAANVKLCDRHGCEEVGDCPAPKAPNSRDRWYFCQRHAAEYNQKWDYFEGTEKVYLRYEDECFDLNGLFDCECWICPRAKW